MALRTIAITTLAATAAASSVDPKQSSAVGKVIEMMEDLKAKVEAEGVAETKAYKKYERFCTETSEEKEQEIEENKKTKQKLKATIDNGESEMVNQEDAISAVGGFQQTIAELEQNIQEDVKTRNNEKKAYAAADREFGDAIIGLDKAVAAVQASKPTVLLQGDVVTKLKTAALLADSMGLGGQDAFNQLTSASAAPTQDYGFHSDGILATLEKLQAEFRTAKQEADENEAKAMSSFTAAQIALKSDLTANQRALEAAKEAKGVAKAKVGQAKKDMAETETDLAENEKYLGELKVMCQEKKDTFDQRSATRTEEITALSEAAVIVKQSTGSTDSEPSAMLFEVAVKSAQTPSLLKAAEAEAEKIEAKDGVTPHSRIMSFFQTDEKEEQHGAEKQNNKVQFLHRYNLKEHTAAVTVKQQATEKGKVNSKTAVHATSPADRQKLVEFLMKKGAETHLGRFVTLAQAASKRSTGDVFGEIKQMIADQIENLKNKAAASQSKKASCDKRISESSVKRDNAASEVKQLNTKMMMGEARRDDLKEDIATKKSEIKLLADEVKTATEMRNKESAENTITVKEAEEALSGIQAAVKVLKQFYTTNAANSFLPNPLALASKKKQGQPAADAPDATFKNKEAYKGSQEASTGIMGLMEVIESDFNRNIAETEAAEKKAVKDHTKFLGESEIATSEKEQAVKTKSRFLTETEEGLEENESSIGTQLSVLKSAIGELASLDEECGVGISYEERKMAREEEIEALKEAIEHINSFIIAQSLR
eukprot:TRINITY_DN6360_c1_g3_i1.p1 TRINITY_DN6360_c1_g3~~TRINITY_DN6360_c1_g3_i1.p1  ORF type:complete len:769 (+),score=272.59 TRINITY_DN6360_c1_g3_i1:155-2461(+)